MTRKSSPKASAVAVQSAPTALQLGPFLAYIFKKIDTDGTGKIDKVELMQELHRNSDLARILGFAAEAAQPDYMSQFEALFRSLGQGNEVTFEQFREFFVGK